MRHAMLWGGLVALIVLRGMARGGLGQSAQDAFVSVFVGAPTGEGA
jgi:hypothetical protein